MLDLENKVTNLKEKQTLLEQNPERIQKSTPSLFKLAKTKNEAGSESVRESKLAETQVEVPK